ncbi:MAG: type II toxin-antitoxin system HicB family antitoxin [Acidobacteria bacterium]|nr:type II toxin-antitoxin system HicB family antitoxin [Acidobacteriota bacterium]
MHDFSFPAKLTREDAGGYTVTFPDLPEAITSGTHLRDALSEAADCLQEAIAGRIVRKDEIPAPSRPRRGQHMVPVALYLAPKLALYLAMHEKGITNSELARRLKCTETVVRRMLDPKHDTRPEKIQAALEAVGKRILVAVENAA